MATDYITITKQLEKDSLKEKRGMLADSFRGFSLYGPMYLNNISWSMMPVAENSQSHQYEEEEGDRR